MRYRKTNVFWVLLSCLCMLFAVTGLQARDLTPEREALPLSQMNAQAHKLAVAPGAAFSINPNLVVPTGMQGQSSDLYAMAMINGRMMIKTPTGWQDYAGSLSVFDRVVLGPRLQAFEFDSSLVSVDAGDSIDFYYFYNAHQLSLRGNGMRFDLEAGGDCDVFEMLQPTAAIETVDVTELPQTTISAACRTIAPRLHVPAEDQGHPVYLYAAILMDDDLMIKTSAGWLPYDGVYFPWFSTAILDAELADFDLPVSLVGDYEGEVWFYYAYLIEREVLMGNALQVNISETAGNLQEFLDYVVMVDNHPGVVLAVELPGDGEWVGVSGYMDVENETPMNHDAHFLIGSATKTFVNMVMLQLLQEGLLTLEDTVEQWLPGLIPNGADITLYHLLTHTSGLFNYTWDPGWEDFFENHSDQALTPHDLIEFAVENGPVGDPQDLEWIYSNTNQIVMGLILERVLEETSLEAEVRRRFIEPLGLQNTFMPEPLQKIAYFGDNYARGYYYPYETSGGEVGAPGEFVPSIPIELSHVGAAGNMISNVPDLNRWIRALAAGELLYAEWQEQMLRDEIPVFSDVVFRGLAAMHNRAYNLIGHPGQIDGYNCGAQYQIDLDFAISACFNRTVVGGNANDWIIYPALDLIFGLDEAEAKTMRSLRAPLHDIDSWKY